MDQDIVSYMGHLWVQSEDEIATIGVNDDGLDELTEVTAVKLPEEGEEVSADEVCGELETEQGSLNLYSPIEGVVIEVNAAVIENPDLIIEDNFGDGWLFRVEARNSSELEEFMGQYKEED